MLAYPEGKPMTKSKAITLTLAILGAVLPFASTLFTGPDSAIHLTPAVALLVSAAAAALYSVDRGLTKLAAGADAKSLFLSTETWIQVAVVLTSIVTAAAGVVPAGEATALGSAAVFLMRITKLLAALPPGLFGLGLIARADGKLTGRAASPATNVAAPPVLAPRIADPDSVNVPKKPMFPANAPDDVTKKFQAPVAPLPRKPDGGHLTWGMFFFVAILSAVACFACLRIGERMARAQTVSPPAGGCFSPTLCVGPSASLTVAAFNLATSNFSGGISPGLGYGLTYTPPTAPWSAVGADIYASTKLGQGVPNQVSFALMLHWLNVYLGVGPSIIQGASGQPVTVQWSVMAGPGVSVQSAGQVYKAAAKGAQ